MPWSGFFGLMPAEICHKPNNVNNLQSEPSRGGSNWYKPFAFSYRCSPITPFPKTGPTPARPDHCQRGASETSHPSATSLLYRCAGRPNYSRPLKNLSPFLSSPPVQPLDDGRRFLERQLRIDPPQGRHGGIDEFGQLPFDRDPSLVRQPPQHRPQPRPGGSQLPGQSLHFRVVAMSLEGDGIDHQRHDLAAALGQLRRAGGPFN